MMSEFIHNKLSLLSLSELVSGQFVPTILTPITVVSEKLNFFFKHHKEIWDWMSMYTLTCVATIDENLDHIAASYRRNPVSNVRAVLVGFEGHALTAPAHRGGMQHRDHTKDDTHSSCNCYRNTMQASGITHTRTDRYIAAVWSWLN